MGSTTETQTQATTLPGAGQQEQQMRNLLASLATQGAGMLEGGQGSLQALLAGDISVSPQDEDFISRISALTGQLQRDQARASFEEMSGAVEGQMLERGLEGSSIEAVSSAMLGRELQQQLGQGALQRQITGAQQLQQQAMQRTGVQLSANQLLLNQILSGAGAVGQMGLQERLAQPSTAVTTERPWGGWQAIGQTAGTIGGAMVGGPAGAAVGSQLGGSTGDMVNLSATSGPTLGPYFD